jgi:hypothetical protein
MQENTQVALQFVFTTKCHLECLSRNTQHVRGI